MSIETWKRAQNLQVVSLDEGAFVGRLDDFQFDLETRRIFGWRLKGHGVFARAGGLPAEALVLVGRDVALIETGDAVEWTGGRPNAAEGRAWASAYRGTAAISRRGAALGAVQDFVIDRAGNRVTGFILHGNRLLPLDGRVNVGPAAVIVDDPDQVVELPGEGEEEREAWWARLTSALRAGEPARPVLTDAGGEE